MEPGAREESGSVVARNVFHLVLGQAGTTALAIVLSAVLGRSLGAAEFGLYFLLASTAAFAFVFVEWGHPLIVVREVARQPGRAGRLLGTALAMRVVAAAAVVAPLVLAAWALGYDARTRRLLLLFFATALPFFLAQGYGGVFRGRDRMGLDAAVSVFNKALVLALALLVLSAGGRLPGIVATQGIAGLAALAAARWLYRRLGAPPLGLDRETARELWASGLAIITMTAAASAQPYLDAIILSKLVPPHVMGWYGAGKTILSTLMAPALILGSASYPRLSRAATEPADFRREMRGALRPMLLLGALGAAGTYLFAGVAVGLIYGSRGYGPASVILEYFSPAMFLLFVDVLLGYTLTAAGKAKSFAVGKVASVVASTALDFVLIPYFQARHGNGGIGVVVAFALSELIVFGGAVAFLPRGTLELGILVDAAKALAAAAATVLLLRAVPELPAALSIPLCVAVFSVVAFALGLVRRSDLAPLRSLWRGRAPGAELREGVDP